VFFTPPPPITYTLPISTYFTYFVPITLTQQFTLPVAFAPIYPIAGPIAATLITIITPRVMAYYFAFRIALLAALWLFGFVAKKIGRPLPGGERSVVIVPGMRANVPTRLPSLGPSVLRGGRGRGRGI
jgi:hypothetical protein